ncbi:TonB-dependent receptor [Phenylobacterium sp. LjRoot225]|uniref:TonB-dependent receptor n=1 Tax=Phenylobacterium sp. LjRoot225 TaxID=3342285 RepID=UPI003ECC45D7
MPPSLPPQAEAVVVYAPRLAPLAGEAAFDVVRLPAAVLRLNARLDEALAHTPGVSLFRRTSSLGANPTTQGLSLRAIAPSGAGRALVTLDEAPQNDPFGGWVIWSALPPEGLAGATIVRGAGAGSYGAGALTGIVALQERGAGEGVQALDVSVGERSTYRAAAAVGGPGLLITASGESGSGYTPVRGGRAGAVDRPLDLRTAAYAVRVQHAFGESEGAARLGVYNERRGSGLAGAYSEASGASATFTLARPRQAEAPGWRLQAWMRASDFSNSSVAVAADRNTTTPANNQYSTPAQGYGLNAALQGGRGGLGWEAGADARLSRGVEFERFRYLNGGFTRLRKAGGETSVAGLYVDADWTAAPWLVTGGVRVDAWRADRATRHEQDLATGAPTLDQHPRGSDGVMPTARFGVRYSLAPDLWVRGAAYSGFRPPTLNELHRPFRVGNDVTEANPSLKPERLAGVEAGAGGAGPGGSGAVRWSATAFYNRLSDPITNVTIGAGPATFPTAGFIPAGGVLRQRQNAGLIKAWGLEGEAEGVVGPALSWRTAFAYTHARVDGGDGAPQLTGKRPAQAPAFTATGGLDWQVRTRLRLSAELRYESLRYEDDLNSRKLKAGLQLDARAAWKVSPRAEVYLAAENLADEDLAVGQTADGVTSYAAPRTVRAGFAYRR